MTLIRETRWDDLDDVVDLLAARSRAVSGIFEVQRDHVVQAWELPGYDIGWVAVGHGGIVGHAALDSTHVVVHAAADPQDGDELLERIEERARERRFGDIALTVVPEDRPLHGLVQRSGFTLEREVLRMWRSLTDPFPDAAWPDDVTVRGYADADGERLHALLDEAYGTWDTGYVARSHDAWLAFMTQHDEFDPELFFLVERDGELLACALLWRETDGRGWLKDLVVREDQRGRGLAKALLSHAFRAYVDRGATTVGLKVDSTNPTGAPQLYERVGFVTDQRQGLWVKEL